MNLFQLSLILFVVTVWALSIALPLILDKNDTTTSDDIVHVVSEGFAYDYGKSLLTRLVGDLYPGRTIQWHSKLDRASSVPYSLAISAPFSGESSLGNIGPVPSISWSGEPFNGEHQETRIPVARLLTSTHEGKEGDIHMPYMLFKDLKRFDYVPEKTKFVAYMNSNCMPHREELFAILQNMRVGYPEHSQPDALGRCSRTVPQKAGGTWEDSRDIYKPYKFVFALENTKLPGYVTEKIVNAFEARAIPVYWGCSETAKRFFNPEAFLDVSDMSMREAAELICRVDEDVELYNKMLYAPMLNTESLPEGVASWSELQDYFMKKIAREIKTQFRAPLSFVSFGVDGAKPMSRSANRIRNEAESLFSVFNNVIVHDTWPAWALADEFEEHRKIGRGAGLWFWKPKVVLDALEQIDENELLLYADAGCMVRTGAKKWSTFHSHTEDVLAFRIDGYTDRMYTQKSTADVLFATDEDMDSEQIAGGVFVVRNNGYVRELLKEWFRLTSKLDLLQDTNGYYEHPEFRAHRHDQSLWSLLLKQYMRTNRISVKFLSISETDDSENAVLHTARKV